MGAKFEVFYKYFITYGGYKTALTGLRNTLIIAIGGLLIGIVLGSIVAAIKVAAPRSKIAKAFSYVGDVYTGLFRGTPIVVQLMIFHFIIFRGSNIDSLLEAVLVFGLNSGAYVAEIMRGGILSVEIGQTEAGRTLGLSYTTTIDTSVAGFVATMDLNAAFTAIAGATYDFMIPYLMLAVVYLILVVLITVLIRFVERRLRKSERKR